MELKWGNDRIHRLASSISSFALNSSIELCEFSRNSINVFGYLICGLFPPYDIAELRPLWLRSWSFKRLNDSDKDVVSNQRGRCTHKVKWKHFEQDLRILNQFSILPHLNTFWYKSWQKMCLNLLGCSKIAVQIQKALISPWCLCVYIPDQESRDSGHDRTIVRKDLVNLA